MSLKYLELDGIPTCEIQKLFINPATVDYNIKLIKCELKNRNFLALSLYLDYFHWLSVKIVWKKLVTSHNQIFHLSIKCSTHCNYISMIPNKMHESMLMKIYHRLKTQYFVLHCIVHADSNYNKNHMSSFQFLKW